MLPKEYSSSAVIIIQHTSRKYKWYFSHRQDLQGSSFRVKILWTTEQGLEKLKLVTKELLYKVFIHLRSFQIQIETMAEWLRVGSFIYFLLPKYSKLFWSLLIPWISFGVFKNLLKYLLKKVLMWVYIHDVSEPLRFELRLHDLRKVLL